MPSYLYKPIDPTFHPTRPENFQKKQGGPTLSSFKQKSDCKKIPKRTRENNEFLISEVIVFEV